MWCGVPNLNSLYGYHEIYESLTESGNNEDENSNANLPLGPVTNTKTTRTRVHVPDNHFIILSGMISENQRMSKTRVPCLGSLPIAGAAFGNQQYSHDRTNVMIFIRPHIINSGEQFVEYAEMNRERLDRGSKSYNKEFQADSLIKVLNLDED